LFDLGGELCIPGHAAMMQTDVEALERELDSFNAGLPPLKEFILPGGNEAAARCHLARTIVRRAEREAVALARTSRSGRGPGLAQPIVGCAVRAGPGTLPGCRGGRSHLAPRTPQDLNEERHAG
jgi:hypothetical protein